MVYPPDIVRNTGFVTETDCRVSDGTVELVDGGARFFSAGDVTERVCDPHRTSSGCHRRHR